jgi:hypothetical protein
MTSGKPIELDLTGEKPISFRQSTNCSPILQGYAVRYDTPAVILYQDAFVAGYQEEEYRLFGMAINFVVICGEQICIQGKNRETVDQGKFIA